MFFSMVLLSSKNFYTIKKKKLKYFPFLNLHRRLISFIYRAGMFVFFSLQWCLDNIIRQECQFKRNLCRILKITDVEAPQEGTSLTTSAALICLSYSEAILLQSLHPMILKTRPLLQHSYQSP